jgi:hypothetical protein
MALPYFAATKAAANAFQFAPAHIPSAHAVNKTFALIPIHQGTIFMKIFAVISLLSSLLLAQTPAFAQETRAALVQKIAIAQGLEDMFEQQIAAQRDSMKSYASKLFEQAIAETGGQANEQQKAAFERFAAKASTLFTAKEITAKWTAVYGKDLSEKELREVLKYYQSRIGQKDIAANQAAMNAYSHWMGQEFQARTTPLLKTLVQELQAE